MPHDNARAGCCHGKPRPEATAGANATLQALDDVLRDHIRLFRQTQPEIRAPLRAFGDYMPANDQPLSCQAGNHQ